MTYSGLPMNAVTAWIGRPAACLKQEPINQIGQSCADKNLLSKPFINFSINRPGGGELEKIVSKRPQP